MSRVFASCSAYSLGCLTSPREAGELVTAAVANLEAAQLIPAVHALRELRYLAHVELRVDGGASHLPKCRSRHFHAALESSADAWLSIDDDLDTTRQTLAWCLDAVLVPEPCIVVAPYLLRASDAVSVDWHPLNDEFVLPDGGSARRARRAGFGLVLANRPALAAVALAAPRFRDDVDGHWKSAPFLESLTPGGQWLGEDFAFFERVPKTVRVLALTSGETTHAGARLDLSTLR